MILAVVASLKSKDPSTQVGAVIVDNQTRKVVSAGYNGFPRYIDDEKVPADRPDKYFYTVHAELNAILHAERNLAGCSIYVSVFPCAECMKAIVQTGIKEVVYLHELPGKDWEASKKATLNLANLAGVKIKRFSGSSEIIDYLQSKVKIRQG